MRTWIGQGLKSRRNIRAVACIVEGRDVSASGARFPRCRWFSKPTTPRKPHSSSSCAPGRALAVGSRRGAHRHGWTSRAVNSELRFVEPRRPLVAVSIHATRASRLQCPKVELRRYRDDETSQSCSLRRDDNSVLPVLRFSPQARPFSLFLFGTLTAISSNAAQTKGPSLMNAMDHGPFVSTTISADPLNTRRILVHKGIAVKVGPDRDAVMVFDTDLLRVACAWTGGFLTWYPARDGLQEWPSLDGFSHFATEQRPGWSRDRKFVDPRPWRYGPVPAELGAYKGLHLHGDQVVFSYTVGRSNVLESPGFERVQGRPVFTRTFNLSPTTEALSLHVLQAPDGPATTLEREALSPVAGYIEIHSGDQARLVGFLGLPAAAKWRLADQHLILDLPPLGEPLRFVVVVGPVLAGTDTAYMTAHLAAASPVSDLARLQEPGPGRWKTLETPLVAGVEDGPFVVDELTVPTANPWRSFLRFSGVDFLTDDRAVVTSLSGDVWIVDGLGGTSATLRWKRFATGLNQPLGVKVVNGQIFVTGRDQITRLHDRNGDGEADFYENFNNQVMAATNFHAFTLNLETDSKGNFYFAKSTPWPPVTQGVKAEITPHHGALFRMPPDGSRLEVIADGLRNPNGLSIGPNDEIIHSDNEGNWAPTSKVHRIQEGGFHGFVPSARRDPAPTDFVKPILWVPHFVDNSPATPIFITSKSWPAELQGQLLLTSYGRGNLSLVLLEDVDGQWQGGHLNLPLAFKSGTLRGRFHRDGHLYIAGLTSWQSVGHGGDWGSFHRVRYTGRPLHLPVAVNTRKGGLDLRFAEALDPDAATDPQNYSLKQWTYPWTSQYGTRSKVYSVNRPGETSADLVAIQSIQLSEDRKTVSLAIPELRQDLAQKSLGVLPDLPDMIEASLGLVMAIDYRLRSADGAEMKHVIHKTIHRVAGDYSAATKPLVASVSVARPPARPAHDVHSLSPAAPAGRSVVVDGTRVVEVRSAGVTLGYDVTEIRTKAGERLVIRYINASEMAHNLVVVKSEADITPVGIAAITAPADDFVPKQERHRIVAASRLANPGDTVLVEFTAPGPGTYPYICTFSGHFTVMQGRLIVEP
ncbi:MAG: hypothetical protein EXS37_22145 [Opitutus sp.]|nr:hypothetical protein [Opitutus sp.]